MRDSDLNRRSIQVFEYASIIFVIISSLLIVATFLLSMPLGIALFYFTDQGAEVAGRYAIDLPIYFLILFTVKIPWWVGLNELFLVVWVIFAVCFAVALKGPSKGVGRAVREAISGKPQGLLGNPLIALAIFGCFSLFLVNVIQGVQESRGIPTGDISFPNEFEGFLSVSYASVIEEIGFRVTPVGLYLLAYVLVKRGTQMFKESFWKGAAVLALSMVHPESAKHRLGLKVFRDSGFRGITVGEWILTLLTSLAFGLAHYFSGSGWEVGKISSASLVGFLMALGYLVYGVHFPILLHWFYNYYGYAFYLGGKVYGSAMYQLNQFLDPFTSIFGGILIVFLVWTEYERRRGQNAGMELSQIPVGEPVSSRNPDGSSFLEN